MSRLEPIGELESCLARVFVFFHPGVFLRGLGYSKIGSICLMYVHFPGTRLPRKITGKRADLSGGWMPGTSMEDGGKEQTMDY